MVNYFGVDQRTDAEKTRQALTAAKRKNLKVAVGHKCEICKKKYPERNLKIHHINEVHKAGNTANDLNTLGNLLIICSNCHDDVHHKPISKAGQKKIIQKRSATVKKEIGAVLRNRPKVNSGSKSYDTFNFKF